MTVRTGRVARKTVAPPPLVGRDEELGVALSHLHRPDETPLILIRGPHGAGKSLLLDHVGHHAGTQGAEVFTVGGSAVAVGTVARVAHHVREAATRRPVVVCVDDAHQLDTPTLTALKRAARGPLGAPVTLVLTATDMAHVAGLSHEHPAVIDLRPLTTEAARTVLRSRGHAAGFLGRHILAQAAGNPAALVAYSQVSTEHPTHGWLPDPLPLPSHSQLRWAREIAALPQDTQGEVLLLAAASVDDRARAGFTGLLDTKALAAAHAAGVVRIIGGHNDFDQPMVRSATYHRASLDGRRAAHARLADADCLSPHRRAWHAARAASGPHDDLAERLRATSAHAAEHDGHAAAAAALHLAADLSSSPGMRTRMLLHAAEYARRGADTTWGSALSGQALANATDESQRLSARLEVAFAEQWNLHPRNAIQPLVAAAHDALGVTALRAWEPLRGAAMLSYLTDDPGDRDQVRLMLERLETTDVLDTRGDHLERAVSQACIRTLIEPTWRGMPDANILALYEQCVDPLHRGVVGATAWLHDEPDLTVRALTPDTGGSAGLRSPKASVSVQLALAWANLDAGRFTAAAQSARHLLDLGDTLGAPRVSALGHLTAAAAACHRGDLPLARTHLHTARSECDLIDCAATTAWSHRVGGLIGLLAGDGSVAFAELDALFADDGMPVHSRESYLGLADWAAAAVLARRCTDAHDKLAAVLRHDDGSRSPRLDQLIGHARALLSPPSETESIFQATLADLRGQRWPIERARLHLAYGTWLRRQRRRTDARQQLAQSLASFGRHGADAWSEHCSNELRACGVRPTGPDSAMATLSPQEHQVVHLVSEGWTNGQIAAHLQLSVRTVSGHLYRSFPKLGVTSRHQIRDIPSPATGVAVTDRVILR